MRFHKGRPPLPGGRDGLPRSFMHGIYPLLDGRKRGLELLMSTPGAELPVGGPSYSLGHLTGCGWSVPRQNRDLGRARGG